MVSAIERLHVGSDSQFLFSRLDTMFGAFLKCMTCHFYPFLGDYQKHRVFYLSPWKGLCVEPRGLAT